MHPVSFYFHEMNLADRSSRILWVPGVLLFIYIVLRAILLPVTHDESNTVLTYAAYSVWDIVLYTDPIPNNHILNTLLIKLLVTVFGLSAFIVRLPNLLGFILFYVFLIRLVKAMQINTFISLLVIILLCGNIFLIDFFGLARGYAMACAFCMVSAYYAYRFLKDAHDVFFLRSIVAAAVGVYASFTLLNFYVALICMLLLLAALRFFRKQKSNSPQVHIRRLVVYVLSTSVILGLCILVPVMRMVETDQFVFWGQKNFYDDTMLTLARATLYGKKLFGLNFHSWCNIFIVCFCSITIAGIIAIIRKPYSIATTPFIFFLLLAIGTVAVNILQFYIAGTPFLTGRTALIFIPVLSFPFVFLLQHISTYHKFWQVPFTIPAALYLIVFFKNINTYYTYEWWFDSDTKHIINLLEQQHNAVNRDITLNTNWLFYPSFNFHKEAEELDWLTITPFHMQTDTVSSTDFYYATQEEAPFLHDDYRVYKYFGGTTRQLLIHR